MERTRISDEETIDQYFNLLKKELETNNLFQKPRQIYNVDESAMFLNKMSQPVVVPVKHKRAISIQLGSSEHISVNCCVAADGHTLPPMIIFSNSFPGGAYHASGPVNALYAHSDSGFMDTNLFNQWFEKTFLKYAVPERPLLLLMDGHSSHINIQLIECAQQNNVILLCLPPHTTHFLQPLDVSVYRSLKSHFSKTIHNARLLKSDLWISKNLFSSFFKLAFEECFTMRTIRAGFEKCGIYPFNPAAIDTSFVEMGKDNPTPASQVECPSPDESADVFPSTSFQIPTNYEPPAGTRVCPNELALGAVESALTEQQKQQFAKRLEEGFDLDTDPLYCTWKKLKLNSKFSQPSATEYRHTPCPADNPLVKHGIIDKALADILTAPIMTCKARGGKGKGGARVLTSEEVSKDIREKNEKKIEEEEKKRKRAEVRGKSRMVRKKTKTDSICRHTKETDKKSSVCGVCGGVGDNANIWVQCDNCDTWYHIICVGLNLRTPAEVEELGYWECQIC